MSSGSVCSAFSMHLAVLAKCFYELGFSRETESTDSLPLSRQVGGWVGGWIEQVGRKIGR